MSLKPRAEHLEWCKQRAREYLDQGNVHDAIVSMMSDMKKHPETQGMNQAIMALGLMVAAREDLAEARRWVEGFR